MPEFASLRATVYGRVQGVSFRAFIFRQATRLGLTGYVRNLTNEEVIEMRAEGERTHLEKLMDYLKVGPPAARVDNVTIEWSEYTADYSSFGIRY